MWHLPDRASFAFGQSHLKPGKHYVAMQASHETRSIRPKQRLFKRQGTSGMGFRRVSRDVAGLEWLLGGLGSDSN
jgi:hypothetical protein